MSTSQRRLLVRAVAPASEPITLTEAKSYLRVDDSSEDSLISDLIVAARMVAESFLRRSLITQSWKIAYDDYLPACVPLAMGPVSSITSVTAYKNDTVLQVLSSGSYYLNAAKDAMLMESPLFPLGAGTGTRVEVVYVAGYGNAAAVPRPIKQGMLAHIAHMYDNRGIPMRDVGAGEWEAQGMSMPQLSRHLYSAYREVAV